MAVTVNMHEAKTHLSRLVEKAQAGEEVIISRASKPAAKIVPLEQPVRRSRLGFLKGQITVPDDIKTPFAKEIEEMFFGRPDELLP